ncbi:uncharacterized protein LOC134530558 [Bacillus rossius redtenbacheri]|uniref:uncharacterized protein LOC134530558 n=1 Tax=Bacillus rossius redtenbacheri TaxID=93214 RepID=UPI002FDDCF4D
MAAGGSRSGSPWTEDAPSWEATERTLATELDAGEARVAGGVLAAVVVGALAVVALLFSFALLIDCRNRKRAQEQQQHRGSPTRRPLAKRATFPHFINNDRSNWDDLTFANQMCADSTTDPPAVFARSGPSEPRTPRHPLPV